MNWARYTWRTNQFTELATGMNRLQNGQYIASTPEIVVDGNRAIARGAGHEAVFAGNANSRNAIQIKTPEGLWLKGRVFGLAYHDAATGTNVLIGELQDSVGEVVGTNQVVYPDAFSGLKGVAIQYTYKRSGTSQDILIPFRESLPGPEEFGLPATSHLLVLTEFAESPAPTIYKRQWTVERERVEDERISFGGSMRFGRGQAFEIRNGERGKRRTDVTKRWQVLEGRNFLVERVRYRKIQRELESLPPDESSVTNGTASVSRPARWFAEGTLPEGLKSGLAAATPESGDRKELRMALNAQPSTRNSFGRAFVLDWEWVYDDWWWDFWCGITYLIDGEVHIAEAGFAPGSVIKYLPGSSLWVDQFTYFYGGECNGTAYTILTSVNDNDPGHGEPIGSGNPVFGEYGPALVVQPSELQSCQAKIIDLYGDPGIIASGPVLSTVWIAAHDPIATKGNPATDLARFRIYRVGGDWNEPITVHFDLPTGTAIASTDYTPIGSTVTIGQGAEYAEVTVTTLSPGGVLYDSTVVLTIAANSAYTVGPPTSAMVTIYDPSVPPPPGVPAPSGLVAWWRGENNALDSVASYHGTIYGSVGFNYGKVAQGFEFHSALSERVKVTDAGALDFGANVDFSIEAWIKADQNPPPTAYGVQTIVAKRYTPNDSTATGYALFLLNGNLYCQLGVNGGAANFGSVGPDLRDGQFHHVAVTVDRDNPEGLKLYADGVLLGNALDPSVVSHK